MVTSASTAEIFVVDESELGIGNLLVQTGKLSARDLERAIAAGDELRGRLSEVLVQLGLVSEVDVTQARSVLLGLTFVTADNFPATSPDVEGLQLPFLRSHRVLPIAREADWLDVVMADPQDRFVLKALRLATGLEIRPFLGMASDIDKAFAQRDADGGLDSAGGQEDVDSGDFVEHLKDLASEAPVIRLVNTIVGRVTDVRASDIHLEPFENGLHVRYRIDGVLQEADLLPVKQGAAVVSRIKLLAHIDIAERRLPQDGRIRTRVKGRELDLRISTVPTVHGESVVMRVLDRASVRLSLEEMAMDSITLSAFRSLLARPHGIFLVTGPTGAGKTTTLYAGLAELDSSVQKIITVEDPVEYQFAGIAQMQVHPQIGLTFASALRSILRQDPDIIMIGEMRDGETAQIAVQAALTGHLVLSTLHTNTAASAVIRMRDMGVERYLITSTVIGVVAQRLVRTLCNECKEAQVPDAGMLRSTGLDRFLPQGAPLFRPRGCAACRNTGYKGRAGLFELMLVNDAMRQGILEGCDGSVLQELAVSSGMVTLYEDGLRKVSQGLTTYEEVLRATESEDNG
ncbi:MAG: Flp pilus assembly complex ATPase component TadA [Ramlibacter sp.]|nr:Flp pilus assembly complex ATPase component TadA [Ramlibacter sp.]